MEPIPLPSHIHYELLLQLLERQTMVVVKPPLQEQVQQLIATLRKALAQQKRLEDDCERAHLPIEFRWSLNQDTHPHSPHAESEIEAPRS
jgi:hypothetical protein